MQNFPVSVRTKFLLVWGAVILAAGGLLLAASANRDQVFGKPGQIFFVDADCYSRMTRVREICSRPGTVLRRHDFENYPVGTVPHATAPLDYLIVLLGRLFRLGGAESALDLAGAWISPLLGVGTLLVMTLWSQSGRLVGTALMLALFAASPIVAHGFALGRPDHQSLELACVALALAAEWAQWRRPSWGWSVAGGAGWGLGLWTSLYEPLVLLGLVAIVEMIWLRRAILRRERLATVVVVGGILLAAWWCEGWRVGPAPGYGDPATGAAYFAAWSRQIGELQSMPPWSPTIYRWLGWGSLLAPVALWLARAPWKPLAQVQLVLVVVVFALTCWQVRWGYFLALVYALSLPIQFAGLSARWRPWLATGLVLGAWPLAGEWWSRAHPSPEQVAAHAEQLDDASLLREVAAFLASASTQPGEAPSLRGVLAPWWLSPPLAYWSGQPALAGSSHESLPGILDVDRFYLATDREEAVFILHARQVRWVVTYEPDRIAATAASLLGRTKVSRRALCAVLYDEPAEAPGFLRLALANPYFKVYEVQPSLLPPPRSTPP